MKGVFIYKIYREKKTHECLRVWYILINNENKNFSLRIKLSGWKEYLIKFITAASGQGSLAGSNI